MAASFQFQLAIELTKLFPLRRIVDGTYNSVITFARDLRKSGSDFLVEEELADVFGRGKINCDLEDRFKEAVVKDGKVTGTGASNKPLGQVVLDKSLGPTLERAIVRDPTKAYLATVIQLSLLTWMHGRESLAASLAECLDARYQAGAPGATETSGMEAIQGMLDTCASQTGAFQWSELAHQIEQRIVHTFPFLPVDSAAVTATFPILGVDSTALTATVLLGCMDSLFICQRLPEDRILMIDTNQGFITLVIWAHYCLDLAVLVAGAPGGDLAFGVTSEKPAQVIIKWTRSEGQPEVCLYDSDMRVVLTHDDLGHTTIEACERLPLEDYGTKIIWRLLNGERSLPRSSPLYQDAVQYTLALAISKLPYLFRFSSGTDTLFYPKARPYEPGLLPLGGLQIYRWHIYDAAKVMFASAAYSEAEIESYLEQMDGREPLQQSRMPASLSKIVMKYNFPSSLQVVMQGPGVLQMGLWRLALQVIFLASIAGIRNCGQLPLIANFTPGKESQLCRALQYEAAPYMVEASDIFEHVVQLIVGGNTFSAEETATGQSCFMLSEYGWTVFLSSVCHQDPSQVVPEQLFLQRGIPTKHSTKERRFRVRDAQVRSHECEAPAQAILDRSKSFVPRCVQRVEKRLEYYGTTKTDFRLKIRHFVRISESSQRIFIPSAVFVRSYRAFHAGLWRSLVAPACEPGGRVVGPEGTVPLPLGVVAGVGMKFTMTDDEFAPFRQRICIELALGDEHARWLAIAASSRNVMIRGDSTCVSCAIDSAAALPGYWLVVI